MVQGYEPDGSEDLVLHIKSGSGDIIVHGSDTIRVSMVSTCSIHITVPLIYRIDTGNYIVA